MEINKKSGIYKIEGEFVQNGIFSQDNTFSGFVELEKEMYKYRDRRMGDVMLALFKGIQTDNYDPDKKSRLVLGGIQETKDFISLYFRKVVNDESSAPVVYGLESETGNIEGSYSGEWGAVEFVNIMSEPARINVFKELSDSEVEQLKVKEFLSKGYEETKNLPPIMKIVVEEEEKTNNIIRKNSIKFAPFQSGK